MSGVTPFNFMSSLGAVPRELSGATLLEDLKRDRFNFYEYEGDVRGAAAVLAYIDSKKAEGDIDSLALLYDKAEDMTFLGFFVANKRFDLIPFFYQHLGISLYEEFLGDRTAGEPYTMTILDLAVKDGHSDVAKYLVMTRQTFSSAYFLRDQASFMRAFALPAESAELTPVVVDHILDLGRPGSTHTYSRRILKYAPRERFERRSALLMVGLCAADAERVGYERDKMSLEDHDVPSA